MKDKVRKYIETNKLLKPVGVVIVGLSGGADSVVLLYLLKRIGYKCVAAHCNFHLRGEESDQDQQFVSQLTSTWNIPLYVKDFDTALIARKRKISIEMAARDLRYEWFEELRVEIGAQAVCVAHHKDDNVETLLINLIRGTGIRGLAGMQPRNGYITRPLLEFSRQEVIDFTRENHLPYMTDSSNLSNDFVRNKIRLQVLPLLETINPSVKQSISRTMENVNQSLSVYECEINRGKSIVYDAKLHRITISLLKSFSAPDVLLFEILKDYNFNPEVIREVYQALDAQSGKEFFSPTHCLVKDRNTLLIYEDRKQTNIIYRIEREDLFIKAPFRAEISVVTTPEPFSLITQNPTIAYLDANKVKYPLMLREWKTGDRFKPFGMTQFQKLSDFFINNKYTLLEKSATWLLTDVRDNIIWVVGSRIDDRYKVTTTTQKVLILRITE